MHTGVPRIIRAVNKHLTNVLSHEDELVLILSGHALAWINGYTFPVSAGDVIGFPCGTGIAHSFINDSNSSNQDAGEPLITLIIGENRRQEGDRLYYPLHPEKMATFPRWWHGALSPLLSNH